jgi:1-acyl-sn-glycerol-3-phosphate acyltransferase
MFRFLSDIALWIVLRILLKPHIRGLENVPPTGPVIAAINHTSFLDPVMVMAFLPRVVIPLAKEELFKHRFFGWVFRAYGCIPIRRGEIHQSAIRRSLELLRDGGLLLVAPEGTRSRDGRLQPGHSGVALLATRTNATILPISIWGVMPFGQNVRRLRRTEVHMVIGKPFRIAVEGRKLSREQLDEITDEIMYQLAELLPPEHRGVYENLNRPTKGYLSYINSI